MFQTEILKFASLKTSISSLFQNLSSKSKSSRDYDITVIVKEADQQDANSSEKNQCKKSNTVMFTDNLLVLNEDLSHSNISLDSKIESFRSLTTEKSKEEGSKPKPSNSKIRFKKKEEGREEERGEKENKAPDWKIRISSYVQTEENCVDPVAEQVLRTEEEVEFIPASRPHTQFKITEGKVTERGKQATEMRIQESSRHTQFNLPMSSEPHSTRVNNLEMDSQNSQSDSEEGQEDGGFLIENYLSLALELIEGGDMEELENFLYKFKEKHNLINLRAETKWSFLMGYCKEQKLEFERAATNYSQVIAAVSVNPLILSVDVADIYCRLGRCYFEIGEWNKAITAYSSSLNLYRKGKKCVDYANCITNLGVLYLEIGYFIQAERCFLMGFNIRRSEGEKKDKVGLHLLKFYYYLFDCNLRLRNFLQCETLLANVARTLEEAEDSADPLHRVRYNVRCGKLLFFQGKLEFCENYYLHALNIVKKHSLLSQEHAEVLELLALLKHELRDLERSRFYYERAFNFLQKCVPIESRKLQTLKKRIEIVTELINTQKDGNKAKFTLNSRVSANNRISLFNNFAKDNKLRRTLDD